MDYFLYIICIAVFDVNGIFHYSLFVCDDIEIRRVKSPLPRALQPVSGRAGA